MEERFQISSIRKADDGDVLAIVALGVVGTIPRTALKPGDVVRIEVVDDVVFAEEPKRDKTTVARKKFLGLF